MSYDRETVEVVGWVFYLGGILVGILISWIWRKFFGWLKSSRADREQG